MTGEWRPPRPALMPQPRDGEVVFVPEDEPPITQRAIPQAPPRYSRPMVRAVPSMEEQFASVHKHLVDLSIQQDQLATTVTDRFNIFHQELALTRHDVAETAKLVDDLADSVEALTELVKDNHEKRLAKVEATSAQAVKAGGKYGSLLLLGSVLAEAFPQWGNLIRAVLGMGH